MEEACNRANEITSINSRKKEKKDQKIMRPYFCKQCEGYHLTCMSKGKFKFCSDPIHRAKVLREKRVKREVDHWERKFGISNQ